MIDLFKTHPESCCGCSACENACPQQAITLLSAYNGFMYPEIDSKKCVECGICLKVCNFKKFEPTGVRPECFAIKHRDEEEVRTSRSGAFFMAICKYVIDRGGIVFGAELDDSLQCIHTFEETYLGCQKFKGSKYVQSIPGSMFSSCANALKHGKVVCYSGTGCQVHGLINYLKQINVPTDNLIAVDVVCHGVPSPKVWKEFIKTCEEKIGSKIVRMDFRDKSVNGWSGNIETYYTADGEKHHAKYWSDCYNRNILFRESCYQCKYTTPERVTDFTIADYWGIGKNAPQFDDNKGCSMVLVHTEKGRKILDEIKENLIIQKTDLVKSLQPQLKKPVWQGWDYKKFWHLYKKNPHKAINKFFFPSPLIILERKLERNVKDKIKKVIKR